MTTKSAGSELSHAIAAELRAEQARHELTYQQIAERSGIPLNSVSRYLRHERPLPMNALQALCDALQVDMVTLFRRASESLK